MAKQDKDWEQEYNRVKEVGKFIDQKINRLKKYIKMIKERVIGIRKDFWEDVTVNLTEMDDAIETQASLKQQAEFLSERERSHGQLSQQLNKLLDLKEKPYFGRIDFIEDKQSEKEQIYIGTSSLMDQDEEHFIVYDWRAPIASMYYDYSPGPAAYEAIDERIEGEMTLKRQYVIKQGELTGMFDTGLTIGDHLLQNVLGQFANTKMQSIVATIQREQNKIIRNEKSKFLIVQGVAGSGKTSAALQRAAYLLYRYRKQLTADQMILFSPNPLFNSYVSRVLPDLGEENIKQMTFYHYVEQQLRERFKIESPFEQLEVAFTEGQKDDWPRLVGMRYKSSEHFQARVDTFLTELLEEGLQFRNIRFRDQLVFDKQELAKYFYRFPDRTSIQLRLEKMTEWILQKLKEMEHELLKADWVQDEVELLDKDDFQDVFMKMQEQSYDQSDSDVEAYYLKRKVIKRQLTPLREKVKRYAFVNTKRTYLRLFDQEEAGQGLTPEEWKELAAFTKQNINENFLTWEDATPFLYFEKMIIGFEENRAIKHIILDEAQDYSTFQLRYLTHIYPNSRMTLLGDINQTIYYHSLTGNILADYTEDQTERITLLRSYRSTRPIVEFTRSFIENGEKIEPFNREGNKPIVYELDNPTIAEYKLYDTIDSYLNKKYGHIAVITKTIAEAKELAQLLAKSYQEVQLIDEETHTFKEGIHVIPVYLAKGIEFDGVIVYDASAHQYLNELERHILYTACTRAMHDLTLIAIGGVSRFVKEVPESLYHFYKVHEVSIE
ncbi:RNA polymerase recycling motor HelD [Amphibacillus sp. Q70]|uniref:RNA polymerase recycling motor HelD n=1 Tax=Amphibacillus sp. Q70 TaxID=3453416 RepID=UPI003F8772D2